MENQIKFIRECAIRANPEIVELKFGCEIKMLWGDYHGENAWVEYKCGKCRKHKLSKNCRDTCYDDGDIDDAVSVVQYPEDEPKEWVLLSDGKDYEIIGRPIRLADVLLAIRGDLTSKEQEFDIYKQVIITIVGMWIKNPDDLSLQNKETIEFISNLLKSE